jgi:hypothetical protein
VQFKSSAAGVYDGGPTAKLELRDDRTYTLNWGADTIEGSWSEVGKAIALDPEKINGKSVEKLMTSGTKEMEESGKSPASNFSAALAQWRLEENEDVTSLTVTSPKPEELGAERPPMFRKH